MLFFVCLFLSLTCNPLWVQIKQYMTKKNHIKPCSQNHRGHCRYWAEWHVPHVAESWTSHLFTYKLMWKSSNWSSLKKIFLYVSFKYRNWNSDLLLPLITYHWNNLCTNKCHRVDLLWGRYQHIYYHFVMITNINWLIGRGKEEGRAGVPSKCPSVGH